MTSCSKVKGPIVTHLAPERLNLNTEPDVIVDAELINKAENDPLLRGGSGKLNTGIGGGSRLNWRKMA